MSTTPSEPTAPRATVAIVGRPNVGKSTLFNRLTRSRAALVSDLPGLTRDRREGVLEIEHHAVRLFDTAGLEEAAEGSIPARMRAQAERGIEQADLVLFVIDARAGVTPVDEAFAARVRRSGKAVLLVANKCEGKRGLEALYEAFTLGLGDPIAVSAEHGEGIGDLVEAIAEALGIADDPDRDEDGAYPASDDEGEDDSAGDAAKRAARPIKVAIVGRPNAGKSTLVNAILGEDRMLTGPEPGLTRDAVSTDLQWQGRTIRLFDTAGLRRKARVTEVSEKLASSDSIRAIRFAEVVVLLVDAERPFEQQDLVIGDMVAEEGRALVIAINKWDLVANKQSQLRELREMVEEKLAQVQGVTVVTVSAIGEQGIDRLMAAVLDAYDIWNRRIATADLNRWLEEALARHSPPASSGRRIKIRYMTQPSTRPPTFVAFCSKPGNLPASYVRYLVNGLRSAFGLPGTPIRFSLRGGANPYAPRRRG